MNRLVSLLPALLLLGMASCNNTANPPLEPSEKSLPKDTATLLSPIKTPIKSYPLGDLKLDSIMQGIWFADTTQNALFYIEKDTLVYVEHQDQFYFVAYTNDTITFILDDGYKAPQRVRIIDERTIMLINLTIERDSLVLFKAI